MNDASQGNNLRNEFDEMNRNLTPAQRQDVLHEMRNLAGTSGYEDVHFKKDGSIVFNPRGESLTNETQWQYSSETRDLYTNGPDSTNTLRGKLDGARSADASHKDGHAAAAHTEQTAAQPAELTDEQKVLGQYDTPEGLRALARSKGREDLIDTSKTVAHDILAGKDVYSHFAGENAHDQRLLWKLSQAELLKSVTPDSQIGVSKSGENTYVTMKNMEGGANILLTESNLGVPRDATVFDNVGIAGTGIAGSSVMAQPVDAFVTPTDRQQMEANKGAWAKDLSDRFYGALKGENWDRDIKSMREQMDKLKYEPDSPEAQELRKKLEGNKLFKFGEGRAHGS
ncbi:MAG: hypothetical protein KC777_24215 [Cyanobacteria bacterium HKST-UBA02]|nr:hypothetical protein [Cyanobacteria bacterium HKST-UBA02]